MFLSQTSLHSWAPKEGRDRPTKNYQIQSRKLPRQQNPTYSSKICTDLLCKSVHRRQNQNEQLKKSINRCGLNLWSFSSVFLWKQYCLIFSFKNSCEKCVVKPTYNNPKNSLHVSAYTPVFSKIFCGFRKHPVRKGTENHISQNWIPSWVA